MIANLCKMLYFQQSQGWYATLSLANPIYELMQMLPPGGVQCTTCTSIRDSPESWFCHILTV